MSKFVCICLSPTIQRTALFDYVQVNSVNRSKKYRMDASGKAVNSARVLNQLEPGCAVSVCPLGTENCLQFMKLAGRDGMQIVPVEISGRVRECWTLLDRTQGTTTELVTDETSDNFDFTAAQSEFLSVAEAEIEKCSAVLLAGSCPRYFSGRLPAVIAKMTADKGKVLMADYCGDSLTGTLSLSVPDIIKINEAEFCSTFDFELFMPEENLRRAVAEKSRELNSIVVVTRGKKATFAADKGAAVEFQTENVRALNTTACGDSFSAGFLYEYVQTYSLIDALAKGTWCAARNAESVVPGSVKG